MAKPVPRTKKKTDVARQVRRRRGDGGDDGGEGGDGRDRVNHSSSLIARNAGNPIRPLGVDVAS